MKRLVVSLAVLLVAFAASIFGLAPTQVSLAQSNNFCPPGVEPRFILGFEDFAQQNRALVGQPVECEHHDAEGNAFQRTSTGQLMWTKATNTITFAPLAIDPPPGGPVSAVIFDVNGRAAGTVGLITNEAGAVVVQVEVSGYEPVGGNHGIHIHAIGICEPPFTSAGGHFNPTGAQHGLENPAGPHAGDLPNMQFYPNGSGEYEATTDRITLGPGPRSIIDADGSALVIHAGPDDQVTDPTGNSGDRIGCAVLAPPATAIEATAAAPPPPVAPPATATPITAEVPATATPAPTEGAPPATATLVPTQAPPPPPSGAQNLRCVDQGTAQLCAWVSNGLPSRRMTVTVFGRLYMNGVPQAGQPMETSWAYRSETESCSDTTGTDGVARCERNISTATVGNQVNVTVTIGGYQVTTFFVPR